METKSANRPMFYGFLLVALAFTFGGSSVATKIVTQAVSATQGTFLRIASSLLVFQIILMVIRPKQKLPLRLLPKVWLSGILLLAIPYIFFFMGMRSITPGLAGIIEGTLPIFVFLFALRAGKRRQPFPTHVAISLIIGFAGVLLAFGDKLTFSGNLDETLGVIFVFLEVLSLAAGTIVYRNLLAKNKQASVQACAYHQNLACLLIMLVLTGIFDGYSSWLAIEFNQSILLSVLFLGIFPTAIGVFIYAMLLRAWGPVKAGSFGYLVPVAAFFLDYLFFGNLPNILEIMGVAAILSGVFLLQMPDHRLAKIRQMKTKFTIASRVWPRITPQPILD